MSTSLRSGYLSAYLTQKLFYPCILATVFTFTHCSDKKSTTTPPAVNLSDLQLKDFPLSEVAYVNIQVTHPEIAEGREKTPGKINITIPSSYRSLRVSLKQFDTHNGRYSISPAPGILQDFASGPVTYTISAAGSAADQVHYAVTVTYDGAPFTEKNEIKSVYFDKASNPALTNSIEPAKIATYDNTTERAVYMIVPAGTDFSKLVPSVNFDAAKLYYRTDGAFKEFATGMVVDFRYPKHFELQAENSLGVKSGIYHVIVDVKEPIRFEQTTLTTENVKTGTGSTFQQFLANATWTNVGNHPITAMTPDNYEEKTYPVSGYTGNANIITATISNPVSGTNGVLPGEKGHVDIKVSQATVAGEFSTRAVFRPVFRFDSRVISNQVGQDKTESLFSNTSLTIRSTLVN